MPQKIRESKSKTKRRGNNEGSIYQRKDGRWCGAVTVGYKTDGKPVRKTVYGSTRQEVARMIPALTESVFNDGYITVSASKGQNFEVLFREWFDLFVAPNLASVTEGNRRGTMRQHIFPAFGDLNVQNVDLNKLQRFFNEKVKEGLSSDYINKMKGLLNRFFKYAVKQNYITTNPIAEVVVGSHRADETSGKAKALRPEIRQDVLTWVLENPILKPIVIVFSFTGLRPQELIVLKWENVIFETKTIFVKRALNRVISFDDAGNVVSRGVTIGKTKTPKSVRSFLMPSVVQTILNEWLDYCKDNGINSEFVFPNTKTGKMRSYSGLRSLLKRFIEKHDLADENISLYTFRHTFATMLLEQRESPKIVAQLMGHAKVSTTLDIYSHVVSNSVYERTAQILDGVYSEILQKKQN